MSSVTTIHKRLDHKLTIYFSTKYGANTCQLCGQQNVGCGVMHIKGKKANPELRYEFINLLWAGWQCCHFEYDHGKDKSVVEQRIKSVKGDDIFDKLNDMSLTKNISMQKVDWDEVEQQIDNYIKEHQ